MRLGVVAALSAEAGCLAGRGGLKENLFKAAISSPQQLSGNLWLMISGIGGMQAERAAQRLIEDGADALLSWGCAGALSTHLQAGDLLIPVAVQAAGGGDFMTDSGWHARLCGALSGSANLATDALFSSDVMVAAPQQKQVLRHSSGAVAVDMESVSIAMAARRAQIPFMAIRAIVDDSDTAIPACINSAMDRYGNVHAARMLRLLVKHPSLWPRLMRLGRQFKAARSTLSLAAALAGPDFSAFSPMDNLNR